VADPFAGKTAEELTEIAQVAFDSATATPARSAARRMQWQIFDAAMGELMARAMSHVLWQLHEREKGGGDGD
jgi:hypothetical protein